MGDTMATQEAYVQVKDLKKHYGDGDARLTVLDGIDTSINRGEICVMLGPSGSGKSTFLNLIGGLEGADAGSILVDGCDLTVLKPTDLGEYRRRELGFVFQFYSVAAFLCVGEVGAPRNRPIYYVWPLTSNHAKKRQNITAGRTPAVMLKTKVWSGVSSQT